MNLNHKTAIVTGASSGLGAAIARKMAAAGAAVAVCYHANRTGAQQVVDEIRANGGEAVAVGVDITIPLQVQRMVAEVRAAFGRIDILVNNASIYDNTPILDLSEKTFDRVISVNILGTSYCTKYVVLDMLKNGGGVVVTVAGKSGHDARHGGGIAYTASKSASIGCTYCNAIDYGIQGVRFVTICPNIIDTSIGGQIKEAQQKRFGMQYVETLPYSTPQDVGKLAVFVASDSAEYMHGSIVTV